MLAVFGLGPQEIVLLAVVGVLLFGRKLPETARYLGKAFTEFKHGWNGMEDHLEGTAVSRQEPVRDPIRPPQRIAAPAPRFQENL